MRLWPYFRYCFGRGHQWVSPTGEPFKVKVCESHERRDWGRCCSSSYAAKVVIQTTKGSQVGRQDRVCSDCEKVELHDTKRENRRQIASAKLHQKRRRSDRARMLRVKAAQSRPHPRALTEEEASLLLGDGIDP